VPLSAVDSVSPALAHTEQQLFAPIRVEQWTRLALVGLFAGEMSCGGGCNFNYRWRPSSTHPHFAFAVPHDWAHLGPLLAAALIAIPILWLLLLYLNSRMRFVLFDSVVARNCEIGRMWRERREPALHYFLWQLVFSLVTLAGVAVLLGLPALAALVLGWLGAPRAHLIPLILAGILVFFLLATWLLLSVIVLVFTKDFVVPQMALEDVSAFEGWRRLWAMLEGDSRSYALYGGMKFVMALAAALLLAILALIIMVILLIPFGGLGAIAVFAGKAVGLTWNVFTITAAVVAGSVFLLAVVYAVSLASVPVIVFFPAYSIYFFAARYAELGRLIYREAP
jgi:hypothetical protein